MSSKPVVILGIESSCDDTSAAVIVNGKVLANIIANQKIHEQYGGVVPELASRAHLINILPTVDAALKKSGIAKNEISAIAYTRGPGLMGSLLVGSSFAKAMSLALDVPLIEVNHMQAHILAHFIDNHPKFPFLCLTVSGGHTQLVVVKNYFEMELVGETIDDAAGEAFDKAAKIMNLPYPGGPLIDKFGAAGNKDAFKFSRPNVPAYNFSFSGIKTSFLYFIQEQTPEFIEQNKNDICASIQHTIIICLLNKLIKAAEELGISEIAIAGGVSANSYLRKQLQNLAADKRWQLHIPAFEYCTDNAAMIAITGYHKFLNNEFSAQNLTATAKYNI
jgi:N6-L-threonylcarbamoyladenine synthase